MANEFQVLVQQQDLNEFQVVVQQQDLNVASTQLYNPITIPKLSDIGDVDASSLTNGSVLVYKTNTGRWTSTTTLDAQNMDGGEF